VAVVSGDFCRLSDLNPFPTLSSKLGRGTDRPATILATESL